MPLYKTLSPNAHTTVKIWKITETYNDLLAAVSLRPENLERVLGMKSEVHRRGFLSVRKLLLELGYADTDLYYNTNGKPFLKDGKHISITHSFTFSAIVVSDQPVGIDIEKQRHKIKLIASKFTDYESAYLSANSADYVNKLTVVWCIKEALYKLFATPGLSFKDHTLVIPFEVKDSLTKAWIDYKNIKSDYNACFTEFEGFTCAYVLKS